MNLSEKKTKVQEIDNKKVWDAEQPKIFLRGKEVEKVREFVYLGSVTASDARDTADVERRLKLADNGIARMRRILWDKSLPQVLRVKMLSSFIYPIATYGCETWALSRVDKNKLRKWWMKILRMIYGVRWYHKVADTTILKGLACSKHLTTMIKSRRLRYAGHLYRYPEERFARKSLFAIWPAKKLGRGGHNAPNWNKQVAHELAEHALDLETDKKVFRKQLDEIYENSDIPEIQGQMQ